MAEVRFAPENRYHRPYNEIQDDELLLAIRKNAQDAAQCRAELIARGWTDAWFAQVGVR